MNQMEFKQKLILEAELFGIKLDREQADKFYRYYEMLIETNKVMNLTAITKPEEVITKHFIDSLSLAKVYPNMDSGEQMPKIADLGTGAGFPGIPLKIAYPGVRIVLMDSLGKRVKFLQSVIRELGLSNTSAIHGRAEDIGRNPEYREKFDLCVSRAVANMAVLSEYCLPLVKKGGVFIAYKSEKAEEEIKTGETAIERLGGEVRDIVNFKLPNGDERNLAVVDKVRDTPKKYPRKAGTPSKEPITE